VLLERVARALRDAVPREPPDREVLERPPLAREVLERPPPARPPVEREPAARPVLLEPELVEERPVLLERELAEERPVLFDPEVRVLRRLEPPLELDPDPPLLACGISSSLGRSLGTSCTLLLLRPSVWRDLSRWQSS
jgi:hypothetical protein